MADDENCLSQDNLAPDLFGPIALEASPAHLEGLAHGKVGSVDAAVTRVEGGRTRVAAGERRRRECEIRAPLFVVGMAEAFDDLRRSQAGELSAVAFVEAPGLKRRDPHLVHHIEDRPQRPNRPSQVRAEADVDRDSSLLQQRPAASRIRDAMLRQVRVQPPRKLIVDVPL